MYAIENIRVIDGDAIEANVLLPFGQQFKARIRLRGWWADELIGPWATTGQQAKLRLEEWIKGKALWIRCAGSRKDRYGRILAHLFHHEQIINPKDVLGELQLSEAEHKRRRDLFGKPAPVREEYDAGGCSSLREYGTGIG